MSYVDEVLAQLIEKNPAEIKLSASSHVEQRNLLGRFPGLTGGLHGVQGLGEIGRAHV